MLLSTGGLIRPDSLGIQARTFPPPFSPLPVLAQGGRRPAFFLCPHEHGRGQERGCPDPGHHGPAGAAQDREPEEGLKWRSLWRRPLGLLLATRMSSDHGPCLPLVRGMPRTGPATLLEGFRRHTCRMAPVRQIYNNM
ncbi:MAG: hypothetical protein MZV64_31875 [Ignavibacteriales bacterium]|nr:hypothetical protein [Ignavibacteriales bacterium]